MNARRRSAGWIAAAFVGLGAGHLLVGRATHAQHAVHAVFGAAYLLHIVAAAAWLGPAAGVLVALASAAVSLVHASGAWADPSMPGLGGLVQAGVYVFVGAVSAALVGAADRERRARVELERRAEREALVQALASLSGALRERDDGTAAHCERVAELATRMARAAGLDQERVRVLRLAALVHDVGKIGVRDDVLLKLGELTAAERDRIERHPAIAAAILRPIRGAEEIAELVLSHHECPDGSGYPRRLRAPDLPPLAGWLRVADVYAALSEARPYKPALPPDEVLSRMRALEGKLDPAALAVMERCISRSAAAGAR